MHSIIITGCFFRYALETVYLQVNLIPVQIRDSNRAMIMAAATQQHCKVIDLGIVRDDEEELERAMDTAFSSGIDILITSGGVSMGDKDFVKPLLKRRGAVHFSKVDQFAFHVFYTFSLS